MEIIKHSYKKRGTMEFIYNKFPQSKVILYPIKNYYFVRTVKWHPEDPVVTRADLEKMELLSNELLGTIEFYKQRKSYKEDSEETSFY
ncbi:hypothetical protein [Niallia nealsonii]|uniref:Uncharacterized protein n=1 Tax=Niallia nealsonii TaxID=115979 RepID=A0A2N0Z1Y6_9BACI|nr:hypothetical protein [Niallia nealsonii]PKG23525.1 hypothetical protein CWS01_11045 [Niallia nealsonii]